jgi:UDPglucose 6-dehydrogenase
MKKKQEKRNFKRYKICVIGTGYVGLVSGAGLANIGHKVTCVDIDNDKVKNINKKIPPIYEKGLKEMLGRLVPKKISATTDIDKAVMDSTIIFICVGTPSMKRGEIMLNQINESCKQIGNIIKKSESYKIIVVKSTVVPGTCEEIVIKTLERYSQKRYGLEFGVVMNPEFLREGNAINDFMNPDRIVLGSTDERALRSLKEVYGKFSCPILVTRFKEAEMIKYASNSFLATKISFINEIGNICKRFGIDTNHVAKGIGLDARISPQFLKSGIGFGGSCFPKDVNALVFKAMEIGYNPVLLRSVLDVNENQPKKFIELLESKTTIKGKRIAILGLTFKSETDDIRESPSISIIKELLLEESKLILYDPMGIPLAKRLFPHLDYAKSGQEAVDSSDVVLILTEWPEFRDLDYQDKLVLDGKNIFNNGKKPQNYDGICW